MLTTIVFSTLTRLPVAVSVAATTSGIAAVLVPALVAGAVTLWAGSVGGALAGVASFVVGHVPAGGALRALGPTPVGPTFEATDAARGLALAVAAVAVGAAGLRRLRL
jgi:hypothetical protein